MSVIEANTGLEVNYDKTSVYRTSPLSVIEANTGLEVNYDKTSVYRIGPFYDRQGTDIKQVFIGSVPCLL